MLCCFSSCSAFWTLFPLMEEEGGAKFTFCCRSCERSPERDRLVMTQTMAFQLKNICSKSHKTICFLLAPAVYCSPIIFNWHPVKSRADDYPYMLIHRETRFKFHLDIWEERVRQIHIHPNNLGNMLLLLGC